MAKSRSLDEFIAAKAAEYWIVGMIALKRIPEALAFVGPFAHGGKHEGLEGEEE